MRYYVRLGGLHNHCHKLDLDLTPWLTNESEPSNIKLTICKLRYLIWMNKGRVLSRMERAYLFHEESPFIERVNNLSWSIEDPQLQRTNMASTLCCNPYLFWAYLFAIRVL